MKKYRIASTAIVVLFSLLTSGLIHAETITLRAIEDFPSIDEGEVPYYLEPARDALAINASVELFRDKFARATADFNGIGGTYDVTLNTLGEEDGDGEYRVIVNNVVVGTVINDPTTAAFEAQSHTLTDIFVPPGATLSVESNAVSNGLIPEGDGFAFARGRWRSLTLQNDNPQAIDLQLTSTINDSDVPVGETFLLTIDILNNSETDTATQALVSVQMPQTVELTAPAECSIRSASTTLTCELPELAPQQSQSIDLSGVVIAIGPTIIEASVNADQTDSNLSNNSAAITIDTNTAGESARVDLQLAVSGSNADGVLVVGDSVSYNVNVTNAHLTTVATAPMIGAILPNNLQFQSSADCTANGPVVLCSLIELGPDAQASVDFTAIAVSAGESEIIISTSATEAEDITRDNESVLAVTVITTASALEQPDSLTDNVQGGNGGGGSISLLLLIAVSVTRVARCRRQRQIDCQ